MLRAKPRTAALLTLAMSLAGASLLAEGKRIADHDLPAWVQKRVQEWQPTGEERRFDEIGWAKDIREALRLGKEHNRPIFLFTHDGHMDVGRC